MTIPLRARPYTVYERNDAGTVRRLHLRATMTTAERVHEYPYREALQGWPESEVFWTAETGPARGVAPTKD